MDNNIYIALSRQMALFRDLDVTANNIANVNTTGYQSEKMLFEQHLVKGGMTGTDKMAFVRDVASYHDERNGPMQVTGNPLDVAIDGKAYFAIETPQGIRYTKNGAFKVNMEGMLVNGEGYPVLNDANQPIQFDEEDQNIQFGENGMVTVDGEERGNLAIAEFKNAQELQREGGNYYVATNPPRQSERARVLAGTLEQSNVQAVTELVRLTELSRAAGSTAKYVEVMYDLQRKSANAWTSQS